MIIQMMVLFLVLILVLMGPKSMIIPHLVWYEWYYTKGSVLYSALIMSGIGMVLALYVPQM